MEASWVLNEKKWVEIDFFSGKDPVKDGWDDVGGMYAADIEMHLI